MTPQDLEGLLHVDQVPSFLQCLHLQYRTYLGVLTHGTYLCQVDEVGPAAAEQGGEDREEGRDGKKKKNRCLSCKKKVGLTGGLFLPLVGT